MILEKKMSGLFLLFGLIFLVTPAPCHAQDIKKLLDVKPPQTDTSRTLSAESTRAPVQGPVQVKRPDTETSGKSWYRRLLEGMATSFAIINTEKQGDGRPLPPGKSR
jgi:hypothetical protein